MRSRSSSHFPIFYVVARYATDLDLVPRLVLAYGMTTLFTLASWFVIESPVLRWKDRIEARERVKRNAARAAQTTPGAQEPVSTT